MTFFSQNENFSDNAIYSSHAPSWLAELRVKTLLCARFSASMGVELQGPYTIGFICQRIAFAQLRSWLLLLFTQYPSGRPCLYCARYARFVSVHNTYNTRQKVQLITRAVDRRSRRSSMPFLNHDSIPATVSRLDPRMYHPRASVASDKAALRRVASFRKNRAIGDAWIWILRLEEPFLCQLC